MVPHQREHRTHCCRSDHQNTLLRAKRCTPRTVTLNRHCGSRIVVPRDNYPVHVQLRQNKILHLDQPVDVDQRDHKALIAAARELPNPDRKGQE
jgi:hypothetical protein